MLCPDRASSASASRLRIAGKARHRIGIEHHGALARKTRKDQLAGRFADTDAGPDRQCIEPPVGKKCCQFGSAIDRPDHDRETCRGIDRERLARTGNGHEPCPGPQCAAGGKPRGAGRPRWPRDHHGMPSIVFVASACRHRKILAPQRRRVLKSLGRDD